MRYEPRSQKMCDQDKRLQRKMIGRQSIYHIEQICIYPRGKAALVQ